MLLHIIYDKYMPLTYKFRNRKQVIKMFLTRDELTELTGYKKRPGQIRWLAERGYKFEIGRDGRPRVLRAVIIQALGNYSEERPQKRRVEPKWDKI